MLLALLEAFGNLTNWSMHPFYKRRLSSAYMLHRPADGKAEPISYERRTHFRRELSKRGPQLVVCAAANVSDVGVTPPGRSALSFTFTREAIGCPTASIPTEAFGHPLRQARPRLHAGRGDRGVRGRHLAVYGQDDPAGPTGSCSLWPTSGWVCGSPIPSGCRAGPRPRPTPGSASSRGRTSCCGRCYGSTFDTLGQAVEIA